MFMALISGHTELVQLLVDHGAVVNILDKLSSPLQVASGNGDLDAVQLLLEHGGNATLLHLALINKNLEVVE
jgi:ankyrin repeat protein